MEEVWGIFIQVECAAGRLIAVKLILSVIFKNDTVMDCLAQFLSAGNKLKFHCEYEDNFSNNSYFLGSCIGCLFS